MADRRPPQRPATSAARRNASSGARPAGSRPSGYRPSGARPSGARPSGYRPSGGGNAPGAALRRSAAASASAAAFTPSSASWRSSSSPWCCSSGGRGPRAPIRSIRRVIAATPAVMAPAADATVAPDAPDAQDAQAERREPQDSTALSDLLGSEDTEIAGLTDDQMVQVTDLSVNTSLSPEWQNILLLGVDQRVQGESCRSDTMIICSINTRDRRGQAHLPDARHGRGVHRSGLQQRHLPPQRRQLLRRAGIDDEDHQRASGHEH